MNRWMKLAVIAMVLALALCAAGCKKDKSAAAPSTKPTQASEELAPAPSEEAAEPTQEAPATEAPETSAPSGSAEQPAGATDQPAAPENELEFDELVYEDEEFLMEEDFGTGPLVTVTWATYESMTEAEQAAYRACFSNDRAFEDWSEMAYMIYETELVEDELWEYTSLNLKAIVEYLTGETFT